jgi:hypothetical protein
MNHREQFRSICFNNLKLIRKIKLDDIDLGKKNEAVLIEFRILPHLEFIVRNAILKLGNDFSHTIICGNTNYQFVKEFCKDISSKIKIIKLNVENMNINDYNNLLHNVDFWYLLTGNKILIHQEDSIIFKKNIADFLQYDYIGSPWKLADSTINSPSLGNGGFSVRTKSVMIEILSKKMDLTNYFINDDFTKYHCSGLKLDNVPEDYFFSKCLLLLKSYVLPTPVVASYFSTENVINMDSFAGHQFWNYDPDWLLRMNKLISQFI